MTNPRPHSLKNKCYKVNLRNRRLYSINAGPWHPEMGPSGRAPFKSVPSEPKLICRCHFVLEENGDLYLKKFTYPHSRSVFSDVVNEKLTGDFWLTFRWRPFGDGLYVPFVDGVIVFDRSQWKTQADLIEPDFDEPESGASS